MAVSNVSCVVSLKAVHVGERSRSMAYTVDQIEKHTIVLRLAVSIYKMSEASLAELLDVLEDPSTKPDLLEGETDTHPSQEKSPALRRPMMLARIFVLIKQHDRDTLLNRLRPLNDPGFKWVREYPRLTCYLLVDFAAKGKSYRSCIRDISANGVFIETSDPFEINQEVALCFTLSESNETMPFKVKGRVTQIYPDGIGVQYEQITHYQREIMDTLINKIY